MRWQAPALQKEIWRKDLFGKQFEVKDNPGAFEEARSLIFKQSVFNWWHVCAISVGEQRLEHAHRDLAASVGRMYFLQLVWRRDDGPLLTGFADGAEAVVSGSPSIMYSSVGYHEELRKIEANPRPWILQVQGRMAADRATPPGKLLEMNTHNMLQPHFAEAWTLVGLLSRQPAKFGRLLMAMRTGVPELQAIEKIYDWDEKKLTAEWRSVRHGPGKQEIT